MASERKNAADDLSIFRELNGLDYVTPSNNSLISQKKIVTYPFDRASYKQGDAMNIIFNSGSSVIFGKESFISFTINTAGGATVAKPFGVGSALNLINSVQVSTQSGAQIDLVEDADLVHFLHDRFNGSVSARTVYGSSMGYSTSNSVAITNASDTKFQIPLSALSGVFGSAKPIMAELADGLRLNLGLNSHKTALVDLLVGGITGYVLTDVKLHLSEGTLRDSVRFELSKQMASQNGGLSFSFVSHAITSLPSSASRIDFAAAFAGLSAIRAYAIGRKLADVTVQNTDSYLAYDDAKNITSWRMRLGNLFVPECAVDSIAVSYQHANSAWSKFRDDDAVNPSISEFAIGYDEFKKKEWVLAVNLQSNPSLKITGSAVNNSRNVRLQASFINAAVELLWQVVVSHNVLVQVFPSNVIVNV